MLCGEEDALAASRSEEGFMDAVNRRVETIIAEEEEAERTRHRAQRERILTETFLRHNPRSET